MKLQNEIYDVEGDIGLKTTKASLSEEDSHKLWAMIENPYKAPIPSIVREYVSNCFDSHAEAGVDDAVIVKLGRKDSIGFYISFTDVGVGLSPERMENVFLKIMKSTKENTDDAIGCFGLGSKSGLSYSPIFYINTHFDGVTYKYQYRKDSIAPTLDYKEEYKESGVRNGTTITIPIKNEIDLFQFAKACNNQLFYFKNVVINFEELQNVLTNYSYINFKEILEDDFKMYEGNTFKVRISRNDMYSKNTMSSLHIANGPVNYPIDYNNITIDSSLRNIPVALKFDIGELDIIQTREDVRYTEKTINAIQNKLIAFKNELLDLYGRDEIILCNSFKEYRLKSENNYTLILGKEGYTFKLNNSIFPRKKVKLKAFYNIDKNYHVPLNLVETIYSNYQIKGCIKHVNEGSVRLNSNFNRDLFCIYDSTGSYIREQYMYSNENLNSIFQHDEGCIGILFIKRDTKLSIKINKQLAVKDYNLGIGQSIALMQKNSERNLKDYKRILKLDDISKDKWRAIIKLYQALEVKLINKFLENPKVNNYEDIKLDKTWYDAYAKKHKKTSKSRDTTKHSYFLRRYNKWNTESDSLEDICKLKGLVIYTDKGNKDDLFKVSDNYFSYGSYIYPIALAPSNYEKLKKYVKENDLKNHYTMEEFNENKDNIKFKVLKDLYVYLIYLDKKEITDFLHTFKYSSKKSNIIKTLFPEIAEIYSKIQPVYDKIQSRFIKDKGFMSEFKEDLEGLKEYFNMKEYKLVNQVERLNEFLYSYGPILDVAAISKPTVYSTGFSTSNLFKLLALNLSLQKPLFANSFLDENLLRTPSKEEYEALVQLDTLQNSIIGDNKEATLTAMLINMYEIKNKLTITQWTF